MKEIEINNKGNLIKELSNLNFCRFIYCEDLDEGFLEVIGKSKIKNILCKISTFGKNYHNHIIIQLLKDKKNNKHYIYFDEINKLENYEELKIILEIIEKYKIENGEENESNLIK